MGPTINPRLTYQTRDNRARTRALLALPLGSLEPYDRVIRGSPD